jgi:hypothetical protein
MCRNKRTPSPANISAKRSNRTGANISLNVRIDVGDEMRSREDIPLAVMSVVSAANLARFRVVGEGNAQAYTAT